MIQRIPIGVEIVILTALISATRCVNRQDVFVGAVALPDLLAPIPPICSGRAFPITRSVVF
jgi:hypothetical protein